MYYGKVKRFSVQFCQLFPFSSSFALKKVGENMGEVYGAVAFCGTLFLVPMPRIGSVRGVSRIDVWRCAPAFIFQIGVGILIFA
ncbi:hypothetical protein [Alloprevotella tannerae]|uniref:Uncharacterized protein n=1 Tax=Alloprevotella tannerae TaxID=76122 RepID=A0A929WXW6_9BACT|nr:hypothetical protein [Alloprevotella tannerae]MBF0970690.1 hypothetical protein [Alloprevotella tannerae]